MILTRFNSCAIWLVALVALLPSMVHAQAAPADLLKESLPLRTALHHDPTMGPPFDRLVDMFRKANRLDELIGMYSNHISQFPDDTHGLAVLLRLQMATGDPATMNTASRAAKTFPDNAYLHFLYSNVLEADHDPRSLKELDRAIELQDNVALKRRWIDLMLPRVAGDDDGKLADKHLGILARLQGDTPEGRLDTGRTMLKFEKHAMALEILEKALTQNPKPQTMIEIELAAADAEVGLDRADAAATRLDRLLSKVTPDYWRRPDIVRRRVALVKTEKQRQAMVTEARERLAKRSNDESAMLDLANLLIGFDYRREALAVLIQGAKDAPGSAQVEKATLGLFDDLRDERGREVYLAERVKRFPDRKDLINHHMKSLYLLGRAKAAEDRLQELLTGLNKEDTTTRLLETARFLRRSSLLEDAAVMFKRVTDAHPTRLDARRELAEVHLALGDRGSARKMFANAMPDDAPIEHLLDLVQFMIEQELYVEAEAALIKRIDRDKVNLELRMLLLNIREKLGDIPAGKQLIDETRKLADTSSRYRTWLESSVTFYDSFRRVESFLKAEFELLEKTVGDFTPRALNRRLIFAEIAARNEFVEQIAGMLRKDLEKDPKPEVRVRVRRQLVSVMDQDKKLAAGLEEELKALMADDPSSRNEINARLALHYAKVKDYQKTSSYLSQISIGAIGDVALLAELERLYVERSDSKKVLAILARLVNLEPTERSNWERYLMGLAHTGDEHRLRTSIRRLLAGVERMPLAHETTQVLEWHLMDSYWRSIARLLADGRDAPLSDALALLDSVGRMAHTREQTLWVIWSRAFALNRLNRTKARDEALGEIDRLAAKPAATSDEDQVKDDGLIYFPDGLSASIKSARRMLSSSPAVTDQAPVAAPRQGPMPKNGKFAVLWAFETNLNEPITAIVPISDSLAVICDASGKMYAVDRESGKLMSEPKLLLPPLSHAPRNVRVYSRTGGDSYQQQNDIAIVPVSAGDGLVYLPLRSEVECRKLSEDKQFDLVWKMEFNAKVTGGTVGQPNVLTPPVSVVLSGDKLIAFDPVSNSVGSFDRRNGKVRWFRKLVSTTTMVLSPYNCGVSVANGRVLVYGPSTAVLSEDTGEIDWSFSAMPIRRYPLRLNEPEESDGTSPGVAAPRASHLTTRRVAVSLGHGQGQGRGSWQSTSALPMLINASPQYYSKSRSIQSQQGQHFAVQVGSVLRTPPPTYVNYLARGGGSWSTSASAGGVALTTPAVVWAMTPSPHTRMGLLAGNRMLLCGPSTMLNMRLDLPLGGFETGISGAWLGFAGHVGCVLQPTQLYFVDVTRRSIGFRSFPLQSLTKGRPGAHVDAVIDGTLIYLTGPNGVLCVNAVTNKRVFLVSWPNEMKKLVSNPVAAANSQYRWQGVSRYENNKYGPCMPIFGRVHSKVLYTKVAPNRVVALTEVPRKEEDGG